MPGDRVGWVTRSSKVSIMGTACRRVAHAAGPSGAVAWAKLRGSAKIMTAGAGNFAHPTLAGDEPD